MRRTALAMLALAGIAVGLIAEQQAYDWPELRDWLPDLLAGWVLIAFGLSLLALGRTPRAAVLLLVAGFTWFAFNFETTGPDALQWLAGRAAYVHRGPLFALALSIPAGRPRSRLAAGGVALAWIAAFVWPLWNRDGTALILCVTFVAIAASVRERSAGRLARSITGRGLAAIVLLCAAIGADTFRSLADGAQTVTDGTVLGYAAAVALSGGVLFRAALLDAPESIAERAVALERGGASLQDSLRDLLGDPRLELGLDAVDAKAKGLVATPVSVGGEQVGLVAHDAGTLDDPPTRAAVFVAVGLAAERYRLRADVDRQVNEVDASRRRLLLAEEDERRRLADRLDRGPGVSLREAERLVREALPAADAALLLALDRASEKLSRVRPELDTLVRGLGGVDAAGLAAALERLVEAVPLQSSVELAHVAVPPEVASALWFVASECLANTVKHARAGSVSIVLTDEAGIVRFEVADDGRGGASASGGGIVNLADRVAALGGHLDIDSPPGCGTRVVAELPLPGEDRRRAALAEPGAVARR